MIGAIPGAPVTAPFPNGAACDGAILGAIPGGGGPYGLGRWCPYGPPMGGGPMPAPALGAVLSTCMPTTGGAAIIGPPGAWGLGGGVGGRCHCASARRARFAVGPIGKPSRPQAPAIGGPTPPQPFPPPPQPPSVAPSRQPIRADAPPPGMRLMLSGTSSMCARGTSVPLPTCSVTIPLWFHLSGISPQSRGGGAPRWKTTSCGPVQPRVLLTSRIRYSPSGSVFQKPTFLPFESSALSSCRSDPCNQSAGSARTWAAGMWNVPALHARQNLFLKCAVPPVKPGEQREPSPRSCAPQHGCALTSSIVGPLPTARPPASWE